MRVFSFVRKGIDLEPIEIDVTLVPGLPAFHLIGLPDTAIKESILRIKSALRHQGFQLPNRDQVLIHLKPSHEKKTSQGLDLAITAAYLLATNQIEAELFDSAENIYFYGEVTLEGEVVAPLDLELLEELPKRSLLVTGGERQWPFHHGKVASLQDLAQVKWCEGEWSPEFSSELATYEPTDRGDQAKTLSEHLSHFEFGERMADLLAVAAAGEHNVFVAGPAGTGKTTFAQVLHELLRTPSREEQHKIDKISRLTRREKCGRPYVSPHHSSTEIALLGGGVPPYPGEITRAQHGVLVLDEYLEFTNYVRECLREPIERHEITVCRSGSKVTFPADFLLVASTNLCPCGEFVPGLSTHCGFSGTRCKSYCHRMSGPLLDRFEIVSFSHVWRNPKKTQSVYGVAEIRERVMRAQKFALEVRGQKVLNSRLNLHECEAVIPAVVRKLLLPEVPASHRRLLALYRVARTLADLEECENVCGRHIEAAKNLTIQPFRDIKETWR